jgi:hypothetical protein
MISMQRNSEKNEKMQQVLMAKNKLHILITFYLLALAEN